VGAVRAERAQAIVQAMIADGVDMLDQEAVQAWIDGFNARPFEERDALLGDRLHPAEVALHPERWH
jgi:hypothetical protein